MQNIPGVLAVFAERRRTVWSVCPADERHPELSGNSDEQNYRHYRTILSRFFCKDFIVSDTLPGQHFPTTITTAPGETALHRDALFRGTSGAGGNRLHYLADRAGIRGLFSDADAYHLDQAFPLLMKQLELMLTSGELNPRHQHTVTLYAKGLTCKADTLSSCGYVYLAVYPTPEMKN